MRMVAIGAVAAMVGLAASLYWASSGSGNDAFASCRGSVIAGGSAAIGGPFILMDTTGRTVTDRDVLTKPSLVYFGYTFCPDYCPLDAARNAAAMDILAEQGKDVRGLFITIDPERDTPEVLGEYLAYVHDDMIGLTGSEEQVAAASKAYKTYRRKVEGDDPEFYLMDHTTQTYLMLPDIGFVEFFRTDDTPESVAERSACFIDAA